MVKFIIRRLLISALVLFFVMLLIYLIMYSLPTSYVEARARELASRPGSRPYQEILALLNQQYGMDKDIFTGAFTFIGRVLTGRFGDSWHYTLPVAEKFREAVWISFIMGIIAFALEMLIAIPLGILAARRQNRTTDYVITVFTLIGISLPTFFAATVLKLIFVGGLNWFEIDGIGGEYATNFIEKFLDQARHMIMPILTLVITGVGGMMRYTRTNMLEVLNSDFIRTARAKGVPEKRVINHHAFRNTLIPIVTIIGGTVPALFGGALITESLFAIPGIGQVSFVAMMNGDIPFSMFYLSFMALLTVLGTLVADILYAAVDPRIRIS